MKQTATVDEAKQKVVILLSGGIDSLTCLAIARERYLASNIIAVSLSYGQKHIKELQAAQNITDFYGVEFIKQELPKIFTGAGSTLVDANKSNPETTYAALA